MKFRSRALAAAVGLVTVAVIGACDSDTATAPPLKTSSPVPAASAPDPAIKEAVKAQPGFDVGHTVHLTANGIQPQQLVSTCCAPVVFKNESATPVTVIFNISKISSGKIAPGATWQWVPPNPESVLYHLVGDTNQGGGIEIESPDW